MNGAFGLIDPSSLTKPKSGSYDRRPAPFAVAGVVGMSVVAAGALIVGQTFDSLFAILVVLALVGLAHLGFVLRRHTKLRHSRERYQTLEDNNARLSASERRRIEARISDGLIQELAAASFSLSAAASAANRVGDGPLTESLETAAMSTRNCLRSLRSLIGDLDPPNLKVHGLRFALSDVLAPLAGKGVATELRIDALQELTVEKEHLAYRAVQEAVRNAEEHANASEISVAIALSGDSVVVEVTDDGMGFDTATLGRSQAAGRMGLRLLDDLACEHGAVVALNTTPGVGTTLRLEMPA